MSRLTVIGQNMAKSKYANVDANGGADLDANILAVSLEHVELENELYDAEALSDICAGLEAIAEEAELTIAEGGLNKSGAAMMTRGVELLLGRIGMGADVAVVSVESFGASGSREESTVASCEGIKEQAQNLWDYLVKKYEEIREKVFVWFKKVFSTAAGLKKKAQAIAKQATDKNGTKKDKAEDNFKLGGLAKFLITGVDGKVDGGKLKDDAGKLKVLAAKIFEDHASDAKKLAGETTSLLKAAQGFDKWESDTAGDFLAGGKLLGVDVKGVEPVSGETGAGAYLGARSLINPTAGGKNTLEEVRKFYADSTVKFEVAKKSDGKAIEVDGDQEMNVLSVADAKAIAEYVADLADSVIAFESRYFATKKELDKVGAESKKLGDKMKKVTPKSVGNQASKAVGAAYEMTERAFNNPASQFTASVMASGKALLDVCAKSLSQYE